MSALKKCKKHKNSCSMLQCICKTRQHSLHKHHLNRHEQITRTETMSFASSKRPNKKQKAISSSHHLDFALKIYLQNLNSSFLPSDRLCMKTVFLFP